MPFPVKVVLYTSPKDPPKTTYSAEKSILLKERLEFARVKLKTSHMSTPTSKFEILQFLTEVWASLKSNTPYPCPTPVMECWLQSRYMLGAPIVMQTPSPGRYRSLFRVVLEVIVPQPVMPGRMSQTVFDSFTADKVELVTPP